MLNCTHGLDGMFYKSLRPKYRQSAVLQHLEPGDDSQNEPKVKLNKNKLKISLAKPSFLSNYFCLMVLKIKIEFKKKK